MAKTATKKFSSLMSKALLERLKRQAEQNGQSVRFVMEAAIRHYLEVVVPSTQGAHSDIVQRGRQAIEKHDRLLHLLAKAE
ncbi:MAG: hypothetical protein ACRD5G_07625 [Candidatus Acidiferrales bacterium]